MEVKAFPDQGRVHPCPLGGQPLQRAAPWGRKQEILWGRLHSLKLPGAAETNGMQHLSILQSLRSHQPLLG